MTARSRRRAPHPQRQSRGVSRLLGPVPIWLAAGIAAAAVVIAVAAANTMSGARDLAASSPGASPKDAPLLRYDER